MIKRIDIVGLNVLELLLCCYIWRRLIFSRTSENFVTYSICIFLWADTVVWVSVAILVLLFMVQRFGTDKVGYSFAPIICVWFLFIAGIGVYNFIKFDPLVVKAVNPKYIVDYFKRNKKQAWISLGGVVLAITGIHTYTCTLSILFVA